MHPRPSQAIRHKDPARFIRLFLTIIGVCSSLLLLLISGALIASFTIRSYAFAAALLLPWSFGIFGVAGLIRSWPDAAAKSALSLRKDVVLLSFGITGALIAGAGWFAMVLNSGGMAANVINLVFNFIFVAAFVLIPIGLATTGIYRSLILLRQKEPAGKAKMRNFYLTLVLVWLAAVAVRILAEEAIVWWYGRDLVAATYAAAEKVAKGSPYCIMGFGGVDTFEEMDKRELVYSAIKKRMTSRNGTTEPHFGIAFKDEVYWWSFKRREFRTFQAFSGRKYFPSRWCEAVEPNPPL